MLLIEKGGEAQIADELQAYNTLIPQGRTLGVCLPVLASADRRLTVVCRSGDADGGD